MHELTCTGRCTGSKALVMACFQDGYTPLAVAAQQGHPEVVRVLTGAGAKVDRCFNKVSCALCRWL